MRDKGKAKRLKSLRRQLQKHKQQELLGFGWHVSKNPWNTGGGYETVHLTRRARIEQAIRTINGGKL